MPLKKKQDITSIAKLLQIKIATVPYCLFKGKKIAPAGSGAISVV
jgi:hypothetical protein